MTVSLLIKTKNGAQMELPLSAKTITLGRSSSCTLKVLDPKISGKHCALKLDASGYIIIKDLDTTNGTQVNGMSVTESKVYCNDVIFIGDISIQIDNSKLTAKEKKTLTKDEATVQVKFMDIDGRSLNAPPKASDAIEAKKQRALEQKELDNNFTKVAIDNIINTQTVAVVKPKVDINERGESTIDMEASTGQTKMIKVGIKMKRRKALAKKNKKVKTVKKKSLMSKVMGIFSNKS